MKPNIYAIDFGTSNSLLGAANNNETFPPIPLDPNASDPTVFRSLLYFPSREKTFYGVEAIKNFAERDMQGRFIRSIKKFLPARSFIGTFIGNRPMNLENIIGLFLTEMRSRANAHFETDIDRVVLGRPAKFSSDPATDRFAEDRLKIAAERAGFREVHFLAEPIAAAFGYRTLMKGAKILLVADFGGGTSDFTVMRMGDSDYKTSEVLSVGGVSIAGDILDGTIMKNKIVRYFGADLSYKVPFGSNILTMPKNLMTKLCAPADIALLMERDTMNFFRNLKQWSLKESDQEKIDRLFTLIQDQLGFPIFESIEKTKRRLSENEETHFCFDYPDVEIEEPVTRSEFEDFTKEAIAQITDCLDETLKDAQIDASHVETVCCTGGTARVPAIAKALEERFGKEKIVQHNHYHSVIEGLSERAREISKS